MAIFLLHDETPSAKSRRERRVPAAATRGNYRDAWYWIRNKISENVTNCFQFHPSNSILIFILSQEERGSLNFGILHSKVLPRTFTYSRTNNLKSLRTESGRLGCKLLESGKEGKRVRDELLNTLRPSLGTSRGHHLVRMKRCCGVTLLPVIWRKA